MSYLDFVEYAHTVMHSMENVSVTTLSEIARIPISMLHQDFYP